jgi:hypothetical protein
MHEVDRALGFREIGNTFELNSVASRALETEVENFAPTNYHGVERAGSKTLHA